jgi:ABC-type transporter Mla MlaB component
MAVTEPGGATLAPPPRERRKVQHSMATMKLAQTMYGDGESWTPTQIRRYLIEQMGEDAPSLTTVRRWVVPGVAEEYRRWKRNYARRVAAGEVTRRTAPILHRMRQLREAGVTFVDISIVIRLDEGVALTQEQVRYYLRVGKEPRHPKRKQRVAVAS